MQKLKKNRKQNTYKINRKKLKTKIQKSKKQISNKKIGQIRKNRKYEIQIKKSHLAKIIYQENSQPSL